MSGSDCTAAWFSPFVRPEDRLRQPVIVVVGVVRRVLARAGDVVQLLCIALYVLRVAVHQSRLL